MGLPLTGELSLDDVNVELGITSGTTIRMGSSAVRGLFERSSGSVGMQHGRGKSNVFEFSITSTQTSANIRTLAISAGWDQSTSLIANINAGITLHSNSTSTGGAVVSGSFPSGVTIVNSGNITGRGGGGGGGAGGMAIQVTTTDSVSITNNSGAFIAGGGGGGGGSQGGGGAGQASPNTAGAAGGSYSSSSGIGSSFGPYGCSEGGSFYLSGSCSVTVSGSIGAGGPQGASGGSGTSTGGCCATYFSGSSGTGCSHSMVQTICGGGGSLNPGGEGGSILSATSNQTRSGGGWGLQGSSGGGAGGAAVAGTSVTMTNNGTVYGTVA